MNRYGLPYSEEAEACVLASCMFSDKKETSKVVSLLKEEDFYFLAHRHIFSAIEAMYHRDEPVDPVTLHAELERRGEWEDAGGADYIMRIGDMVPTPSHAEHYAKIVHDNSMKRIALVTLESMTREAYEWQEDAPSLISAVQNAVVNLAKACGNSRGAATIREALAQGLKNLADNRRAGGVLSGLKGLDYITGGAKPGRLYTIVAKTKAGKTALASQWALNAAMKQEKKVLIFSAEMTADQYALRLAYSYAGLDSHRFDTGRAREEEGDKLLEAIESLQHLPIRIRDTSGQNVHDMASYVKTEHLERGVDLVIVDYIQLIRGDRTINREQEVSSVAYAIKDLSIAVPVPVIALSQVNKEGEARESRAIEFACDTLLSLEAITDREGDNPQLMRLSADYNRWGPIGGVDLYFLPKVTRFVDKLEHEGRLV